MTYRARKLWSIVVLVVWLPLYIAAALYLVSLFERPPIWLEFLVYVGLGVLWALPFRRLFLGIGREDPDRPRE
jgi:branched-subunit amino acid transport protein